MTESHLFPTLYDVAREAGVSLATASRVLNPGSRTVAPGNRERVLSAAKRLGYSPNLSAQAMARGTSLVVALVVSDIADPYFATLAAGVAAQARENGLTLTISVTDRDPDTELSLMRELRGMRPRLLLLAGSRSLDEPYFEELSHELNAYRAAGTGVVMVGQRAFNFPSVRPDDRGGGAALGSALAADGFRRVAVAAGPDKLITGRERLSGLREGLASGGVILDDALVFHSAFNRTGGVEVASRIASLPLDTVDVLVALNDLMALGALSQLRELGIPVPARLAVAGFDDIDAARDVVPALTTVHVDISAIGREAVRIGMEPAGDMVDQTFPLKVVRRASSAKPRSEAED